MRQGDWKLILGPHGSGSIGPPAPDAPEIQLYNVAEDLDESENLSRQHPDRVRQLRDLLETIRGQEK